MYTLAVVLTCLIMVGAAVDYVRRALIGETKPVLTTWILMFVMISLALWMYIHGNNRSWTGNIGIVTAFINLVIILTGVTVVYWRSGEALQKLNRAQKYSLLGATVSVAVWFVTGNAFVAYCCVQFVAVCAYVPTVARLLKAKQISEPLVFWVAMFVSNIPALYPAWIHNDVFAWVYLGRSIPSTALMVWLVSRIKRKDPEYRSWFVQIGDFANPNRLD